MSPALIPSLNAGVHGAYVPIGYTSLTSSAGNIAFNNIPQGYQDLFLVAYIRSDYTSSGTFSGASFYANNASSTANYSTTVLNASQAAVSSYQQTTSTPSYGFTGVVAAPTILSSPYMFGQYEVHILNYSNSVYNKTALIRASADINGTGTLGASAALWAVTSPITSISVGVNGNLMAGSSVALYGIRSVGQ